MRPMKILTVGMLEANSKESSSSSSRRHFGNGMFAAILLKSDKKIKLIVDFDGLSLWISYQTEMNLNQQLAAK